MQGLKSQQIFIFFFVFLSCLHSTFAYPDVTDIQFDNYSVADGLTQSTVTDIIEDNLGFMWFATTNGLNRFDGYEFKQYVRKKDDIHSLPNNFIRALYIDSKQRLWVNTYDGIAQYIPEKDHFKRYPIASYGITKDAGSQIWAVNEVDTNTLLVSDQNGLYQLEEDKDAFSLFPIEGSAHPKNVRVIFQDEYFIWLGTNGQGVYFIDNLTRQLYKADGNNPWRVSIPSDHLFQIATINDSHLFATEKGLFTAQYTKDETGNLAVHIENRYSEAIRAITQLSDSTIWLGTPDGIRAITPEYETLYSIDKSNDYYVGLKDRYILNFYQDSKGAIWLGTPTAGLHRYHPLNARIKNFSDVKVDGREKSLSMVWGIIESPNGEIWIATQTSGLFVFNSKNANYSIYLEDFEHAIFDINLDKFGTVWLATSNGIYGFKHENNQLVQYEHIFEGELSQDSSLIDNQVWAGPPMSTPSLIDASTLEKSKISLSIPGLISAFPEYLDENRNLWLNTKLGLVLYNLDTKDVRQVLYSIDNSQPILLAVESFKDFYLAVTMNHGIMKLDKQTYSLVERIAPSISEEYGLFSTAITSDNSAWLAASNDIVEVNLETGHVETHIRRHMLQYDELTEGAATLASDGTILFGGIDGIHVIDPKLIAAGRAQNQRHAIPAITELKILNKPVKNIGHDSPLQKAIALSESITLPHNFSQFTLTFSQLNSISPKEVNYRYRLNGSDEHWVYVDSLKRSATYTNLMFGDYLFEVQSQAQSGDWSPSRAMKIIVSPPLWFHPSALVCYFVVLSLLTIYFYRQYRAKQASERAVRESEERLKLTLWSSGDELWDWDISKGQVFRSNTWGILDFPQDEIRTNASYQTNIHPDDVPRIQTALKEHLDKDTDHFQVTYRAKTFKGEWIWLLDRGKVVERGSQYQPVRMTGTLKNISHLKQAEEQLNLFKRSIETISDGVFITDEKFKFISVNQAYCKHTGETREQALVSYLTFHQYPEAFTEEVKKSLRQKGNWNGEVESRRSNGDKYEMELNIDAIQGENGKISHFVGVFSDITARKSTEKELLKLANTDPLTEMPNRSFFQASHANLVRKNIKHALLCLDMDNFKKINDSLGHQTGDILIKQIGKRLQRVTGNELTCYRLGGDEFSILVDNTTDVHKITHLAQRVLDDLARPFLINKQEFVLGASLGIAFYPGDGNTPQELLKNADTAMYFAKNAGGNKYQFFSGEMNQNAVRQLQIENLIRNGLKEDLFTVFYQPKVDIATGRLVSMEALVRFEHPEKGIVSPAQFIPLAEETGQIIDIGEKVLQKACADTKRWVSEGLFTGRVAVNISARQFELADLDDRIEKILHSVNLSPLHLECEITEGTLMQNPDQALMMMDRLRQRGIHLALDDFGTGYSSLAYLKKFPLNTLKIDKAFIDDIATSSVDKHMAASIINIAHNLGLKVVAEGVELEEQLSILRRYECEMLQGYLYSKPLSSAKFEKLLRENHQLGRFISEKVG
ncbi:EAL domain-containing protein [Aestuariibacter sp. AA17]|uniref:EAL domain-containing protein n=1 Tax=Fluctibacter corallii TaxID=2984329 RepID=A0ABT3AA91_9ALTE|nr:EAL domain-containing protein [Aestuariibacter sp. AA17]MCV2885597.1 EAL domain-containing protein [Aestuariibacter sp. AA17]